MVCKAAALFLLLFLFTTVLQHDPFCTYVNWFGPVFSSPYRFVLLSMQHHPPHLCCVTMTAYKYCPLDVELQEIRLLKLLPGTFDDDIRCEMFHAPLREPANSEQLPKVTVQELQKTLPRGWEVYETIDGRFAFINRDAMVRVDR